MVSSTTGLQQAEYLREINSLLSIKESVSAYPKISSSIAVYLPTKARFANNHVLRNAHLRHAGKCFRLSNRLGAAPELSSDPRLRRSRDNGKPGLRIGRHSRQRDFERPPRIYGRGHQLSSFWQQSVLFPVRHTGHGCGVQPGQRIRLQVPERDASACGIFSGRNSSSQSSCLRFKLTTYLQGAEIFDNALCGGGDPNQGISSTCSIASYNIKAAIFMGDPRFQASAPYNVGTCAAGGVCPPYLLVSYRLSIDANRSQFDGRPTGQYCGNYNSDIKSYCDASDPYCSNGNNPATHQGYGSEYGQQALSFVNSKV